MLIREAEDLLDRKLFSLRFHTLDNVRCRRLGLLKDFSLDTHPLQL
jgi:hypothetical protein